MVGLNRYSHAHRVIVVLLLLGSLILLQRLLKTGAADPGVGAAKRRALEAGHFTTMPVSLKTQEQQQRHRLSLSTSLEQEERSPVASRRKVMVGRPNTPVPSPRTSLVTAQVQPTPAGATWPMKPLHFFHTELVKSTKQILASAWVERLQQLLKALGSKKKKEQVSVVFANSEYLESLLNWLIAARVRLNPPLKGVVVICLEKEVFDILDQREIPAVYLDPSTVANITKLQETAYKYTVWVVRFVVYRLLNYFGYDVVSYDTDAVILQDPQELFREHRYSDIISSAGKFPFTLSRVWGFTACMGVILFRSTPRTELLWESISGDTYDDQIMLNTAFNSCHIQWLSKGKNIQIQSIDGQCSNGLRVTVLPHSNICRNECSKFPMLRGRNRGVYIWHQLSKKIGSVKEATAKEGHVWFLRSDWRAADSGGTLKGIEWLSSLSVR